MAIRGFGFLRILTRKKRREKKGENHAYSQWERMVHLDRVARKEVRGIFVDSELIGEFRGKPKTTENIGRFLMRTIERKGKPDEVNHTGLIFMIECLTADPSERRFLKKVIRAQELRKMEGFARGLLKSVTNAQGKAKAKENLLRKLNALMEKIKHKDKEILDLTRTLKELREHPNETARVRHDGAENTGIIKLDLGDLIKEIERLPD